MNSYKRVYHENLPDERVKELVETAKRLVRKAERIKKLRKKRRRRCNCGKKKK